MKYVSSFWVFHDLLRQKFTDNAMIMLFTGFPSQVKKSKELLCVLIALQLLNIPVNQFCCKEMCSGPYSYKILCKYLNM